MILFRFCLSIIWSILINYVKLQLLDPARVHGHSSSGNAYADFLSRASYSPRGSASTRGAPWQYHNQFKVVVEIVVIHVLPRWSSWRCTSASPGRPGLLSLDVLSYRWPGVHHRWWCCGYWINQADVDDALCTFYKSSWSILSNPSFIHLIFFFSTVGIVAWDANIFVRWGFCWNITKL